MERGGNDYFYHADDIFNVMALTNAAGSFAESYDYDAFGAPDNVSSVGNPYLFNGREYDAESGFYNYRTRYLDPSVGRFTTRDTIGIWGDPSNLGNPYTYVGNNPQTFVDPFGLSDDIGDILRQHNLQNAEGGINPIVSPGTQADMAEFQFIAEQARFNAEAGVNTADDFYGVSESRNKIERYKNGEVGYIEATGDVVVSGLSFVLGRQMASKFSEGFVWIKNKLCKKVDDKITVPNALSNSDDVPRLPQNNNVRPYWPGKDASVAPHGTEWRGKPGSKPGSREGNYYNPNTGEYYRPDFDHKPPIKPHWDYRDPNGKEWRVFEDGRIEPK